MDIPLSPRVNWQPPSPAASAARSFADAASWRDAERLIEHAERRIDATEAALDRLAIVAASASARTDGAPTLLLLEAAKRVPISVQHGIQHLTCFQTSKRITMPYQRSQPLLESVCGDRARNEPRPALPPAALKRRAVAAESRTQAPPGASAVLVTPSKVRGPPCPPSPLPTALPPRPPPRFSVAGRSLPSCRRRVDRDLYIYNIYNIIYLRTAGGRDRAGGHRGLVAGASMTFYNTYNII